MISLSFDSWFYFLRIDLKSLPFDVEPESRLEPYIRYERNYIIVWKVTIIISLIIGIIGALVWLVDLASEKIPRPNKSSLLPWI